MIYLRHIALRCKDMEKSRRFYEMLGMKFVGYRPSGQGLDLSDGVINMTLIQQPPDGLDRTPLEEGKEFIHFGFIVDDAKETWRKLKEWGAYFLREDVKQRNPIEQDEPPPGSYKVEDPDGNVVDISDNKEEWRGVRL